jgi:AAA15 family ATPase/GTPase
MLKSLIIENFRCFPHFELSNLGRVNLLVGKNNSGKSSLLEALQFLSSQDNVDEFGNIMKRRGEYLTDTNIKEFDCRHLFYGHNFDIDSVFSIKGEDIRGKLTKLSVSFDFLSTVQINLFEGEDKVLSEDLSLIVEWLTDNPSKWVIPITLNGGLNLDKLSMLYGRQKIVKEQRNYEVKSLFIPPISLSTDQTIELFDQVVLTSNEDLVLRSIQSIEPEIQRIASVSSRLSRLSRLNMLSRSGFKIKLKNCEKPVPIGSMGDGIWRILGLALSIVNVKNGILLVDEIDTGLHYTAMDDMWKMIWQTANDLNVQVFATTHSNDCWKSLAELASNLDGDSDGIAIHRIEKERNHSISYSEEEMIAALEENYEVRGA